MERRRTERYPIYHPIKYKSRYSYFKKPSITLDISENGALISTTEWVERAKNLSVDISFKNENFSLECKIIAIKPQEDGMSFDVRLQFMGQPYRFKRKLCDEIESLDLFRGNLSKETGREISMTEASMEWYKDTF